MLYAACFGGASVRLGTDANWDLRNYHIYNAFAFVNGKFAYDLDPAQLQTFLVPWVDILFFWIRRALNDMPRLLAFILAIPSAFAAVLATAIAIRIVPARGWEARALTFAAVAYGATGAAGLPTTGSSQTEMVSGTFVLAGLLLLLIAMERTVSAAWQTFASGLLFGVAAGLKLTTAPFGVAALAILAGLCLRAKFTGLRAVMALGAGLILGALATGGAWWWLLYEHYDNPLFPFYNNIFRSSFYLQTTLRDTRFLPETIMEAIFYPFYWGFGWRHPVSEVTMRDPRFAFAYVAILLHVILTVLRHRRPAQATANSREKLQLRGRWLLIAFFVLSFAFWEAHFSIFRYTAPLELLAGLVIVLSVWEFFRGRRAMILRWLTLLAICALTVKLTYYPGWGRIHDGAHAVDVDLPHLPDGAIVVIPDDSALAYVAAFAPPSVRFVGANNNLVRPGSLDGLSRQVEATITHAVQPVFSIEYTSPPNKKTDATLSHYGLHRDGECARIRSNLENPTMLLQICQLSRADPDGTR